MQEPLLTVHPAYIQLSAVVAASAKQIVITVGANTTANASTIFSPAEVTAVIGDTVLFNCEYS